MWGLSLASWLFKGVDVGGGGGYVGCGYRGFGVFILYLGLRYGGIVYLVDAVCSWGRVPRFTLEDVGMVRIRSLCVGHTFFTSGLGR
jgi:hypothetical protein